MSRLAKNKTWLAPAKLNLFLHITGRRDDGYHNLQTVFQLLDYGDHLTFDVSTNGNIEMQTSIAGVADADNLIIRAARLLQKHTACRAGATINIDKVLPMGGGLGGGSSDAATTLLALNQLWCTGLSQSALAELGLQLGADIPVFVRGRSAWAEGVGEKLQPLTLPPRWYVVLNPGVHVDTGELFSHPQLTRDSAAITIRAFHSSNGLCNVFQPLVCELYPPVGQALDALSQVAIERNVTDQHGQIQKPHMTGTGASVFLACETESQAQNVLAGLFVASIDKAITRRGFIARGIDCMPHAVDEGC